MASGKCCCLVLLLPSLSSSISSFGFYFGSCVLVARAATVLNELVAPCCGATVFNVQSPQIRFAGRPHTATALQRCPSTSLSLIRIAGLGNNNNKQQQQQPIGCLRRFQPGKESSVRLLHVCTVTASSTSPPNTSLCSPHKKLNYFLYETQSWSELLLLTGSSFNELASYPFGNGSYMNYKIIYSLYVYNNA